MPTTPLQALPYPALSDAANGPVAFQNLATAAEKKLVQVYADAADRTAKVTAPTAGMVTWLTAPGRMDFYNGTAWVPWSFAAGWPAASLKATNVQNVPNSASTPIVFQSVTLNSGGMADLANNRLIPPVSGIYFLQGQVAYQQGAINTYRRAGLRANAATDLNFMAREESNVTGLATTAAVTWLGQLTAGDLITLQTFQNNGSTLGTSITPYWTTLSGYLVSPT